MPALILALVAALTASGGAQVSPHAYFNSLVARPEAIFSRDLRTSQLGGTWVYDSVLDAARGVVPIGDGVSDGNVGGHGVGGQMRFTPPIINPGDDVLYTWDGWWGPEWGNKANLGGLQHHKAYNVTQQDIATKWITIMLYYDLVQGGEVAEVGIRPVGQGITFPPIGAGYQIQLGRIVPMLNNFIIQPSVWTRFWLRIERAPINQFSLISLWLADQNSGPLQIYHKVPVQAVLSDISDGFWFEFNSSQKRAVGSPALTIYQRNFVVLRGLGDPTPILTRPNASIPPPTLSPPQNVRVTVP